MRDKEFFGNSFRGIETHLVFLKHHEIEVLNSFVFILLHSFHKDFMRNDFANVFVDELITAIEKKAEEFDQKQSEKSSMKGDLFLYYDSNAN